MAQDIDRLREGVLNALQDFEDRSADRHVALEERAEEAESQLSELRQTLAVLVGRLGGEVRVELYELRSATSLREHHKAFATTYSTEPHRQSWKTEDGLLLVYPGHTDQGIIWDPVQELQRGHCSCGVLTPWYSLHRRDEVVAALVAHAETVLDIADSSSSSDSWPDTEEDLLYRQQARQLIEQAVSQLGGFPLSMDSVMTASVAVLAKSLQKIERLEKPVGWDAVNDAAHRIAEFDGRPFNSVIDIPLAAQVLERAGVPVEEEKQP